jgi:hypothetical protein
LQGESRFEHGYSRIQRVIIGLCTASDMSTHAWGATRVDYSWDLMEPVTYFVGLSINICKGRDGIDAWFVACCL